MNLLYLRNLKNIYLCINLYIVILCCILYYIISYYIIDASEDKKKNVTISIRDMHKWSSDKAEPDQ